MTKNLHNQEKTSLRKRIIYEIKTGMASANDPDNAGLADLAPRTTTIYSPWYTRICPECKLKFREGDQVILCPKCNQAYHDDDQYNLRCWERHFTGGNACKKARNDPITEQFDPGCDYRWNGKFPGTAGERKRSAGFSYRVELVGSQFLHGLEGVWRPYGEEKLVVVREDDDLVGLKCPWCRFFIRAGDHVVKCPCGKCNTWFHMDIYRHLKCWNEWNGARGHDHCPTTCATIERR